MQPIPTPTGGLPKPVAPPAPDMGKQSVLIAYPYFKKDVAKVLAMQPKGSLRLIVDSGAFTAWNTGKVIKLDDYCKFLDSIAHLRPFHAVQLDVFGDPVGTYKNFEIMKSRGYDVMPVFTRGDTVARLDEFYTHTDYIMFGGITIGGKNQNYMKWFLRNNRGRMAHWLGFCRLDFIKAYRPRSVDSSSWSAGARFGACTLYSGASMVRYSNKEAQKGCPAPAIYAAAAKMGIARHEVLMLQKSDAWVGFGSQASFDAMHQGKLLPRSLGCALSAITYTLLSYECEKMLGTRYYLVAANEPMLQMLIAARAFLRARKVIQ